MSPAEFNSILHSSLSCGGADVVQSKVQHFLADSFAHVGIASIVTTLVVLRDWSLAWFWVGLAAIITKELAFDLPNGGWSSLVLFDSLWDVACWWVGFYAQWFALGSGEVKP